MKTIKFLLQKLFYQKIILTCIFGLIDTLAIIFLFNKEHTHTSELIDRKKLALTYT